jgi:hypothetical protein
MPLLNLPPVPGYYSSPELKKKIINARVDLPGFTLFRD